MKKNKVISIFLLLITILLSIGLGLCYNRFTPNKKNKLETPSNVETFVVGDEKQYLTYLNSQNLLRFIYLLSNDLTDIQNNIYSVISTMPYYQEYLLKVKYPLSQDTSNYYPLAQLLYPNSNSLSKVSSPLNNVISLSTLPFMNSFTNYDSSGNLSFNIKDDETFKKFINTLYFNEKNSYGPLIPHNNLNTNSQNFMTNLVKPYQSFQQDFLNVVDHQYTANMLELIEMIYVSTFVPNSLYHIYILEYNYILNQYPETFTDNPDQTCSSAVLCNTSSYLMFIQMYQCAMQLQLSITRLIDSNGNIVPGIDYTTNNPSDIHNHINSIMYMFDGKNPQYLFDLVNGLEPSYILFYNALHFFNVKLNNQ